MSLELSGTTPAIKGVAGSVSAPAITGDDVDTGISFPAANTIKFSTNGVERISITDAGISGTGISAGGKFASYAIIGDQKSADSDAGTFTSGAWRTRDLNTELSDPDGIVSISSDQFTLAAGSYLVKASAPAIGVNNHKVKIYNVTDSADVEIGTTEYAHASDYTGERSFVAARFTISGSKAFEIRHQCETTKSSYGLGRGYGMGVVELFTLVEIYKES